MIRNKCRYGFMYEYSLMQISAIFVVDRGGSIDIYEATSVTKCACD